MDRPGGTSNPPLAWARRSRLAPFVKLARTITDKRTGILAAIEHGLSNARVEAI
ncbi:MAG: transposase, partial [Actinomycetota bacterium]|nr:transposase [Actinomycetota bacterium]